MNHVIFHRYNNNNFWKKKVKIIFSPHQYSLPVYLPQHLTWWWWWWWMELNENKIKWWLWWKFVVYFSWFHMEKTTTTNDNPYFDEENKFSILIVFIIINNFTQHLHFHSFIFSIMLNLLSLYISRDIIIFWPYFFY